MTRIGFVKRAILARSRSMTTTVLFVILAVAIPTLLCLAMEPLVQDQLPYLACLPAIMLAAVFLGWRAASLAAFGSAIAAELLLEADPGLRGGETILELLLFASASAILILLGQTLRRAVIELDATARREAFLASELGHRAKNHLSLIEALARQCQQAGQSSDAFFEKLLPRIQTLARAQDLLTRSGFNACDLRALVDDALKPFAHHEGIHVEGPKTLISPGECTPLIMAVHELGTNASKYGALRVPDGRVDISWGASDTNGGGVTLVWQESGGPQVEPPKRRGLGSRLIARHPAFQQASLEYLSEGVCCTIVLKHAEERSSASP